MTSSTADPVRDLTINVGGTAAWHFNENAQLQFNSPYACSKGAADQYVQAYAVTYGLNCVVLRPSWTYGPFQHGTEDQGWICHFVNRALAGKAVTIYGNGCQSATSCSWTTWFQP